MSFKKTSETLIKGSHTLDQKYYLDQDILDQEYNNIFFKSWICAGRLSELKNITEELGIKGASKLSKQDLIYKILDEQAISKPKKSSDKKSTKISKPSDKTRSTTSSRKPSGAMIRTFPALTSSCEVTPRMPPKWSRWLWV